MSTTRFVHSTLVESKSAQIAPPSAIPPEANNPSAAAESQTKRTTRPETIVQHLPDAMQSSDPSPRAEKSKFWTVYERVAKQHDDEMIDRHNGDLDALLIFAGLFSSVSSTFIVNMQSNLSPRPTDLTNTLLKVLINKLDNGTFSEQEASLPVWTGPGSAVIWVQALAYMSLSMSLLAALGGVLGKQWLGHFKTSRFGHGALRERCMRRQQKVDGLKSWHFNTIISTLPILLQLSLLFFGIALAANIWTLQRTVASVIMATTSFGAIFYLFTVVASLKSPDCPFQTPVSTILNHVSHAFRQTIMVWVHGARRKSWADFLSDLQDLFRGIFQYATVITTRSITRCLASLSRILSPLLPRRLSPTDDPESAGGLNESEDIDLDDLESSGDPAEARSIRWIIETSADTDIITTAVIMIPEVEWRDGHDVTFVLNQLTSQLYASFDSLWHLTPHTRNRVRACLKAIFHLYTEHGLHGPLNIRSHSLFYNDYRLGGLPLDQDLLLISCVVERPYELDITSLPTSDRMWMAHILIYYLYNGDRHPGILIFVHGFIDKSLQDPKSPPRLVADCLVLAGLMVGLRLNRRCLGRIDKSAAMGELHGLVLDRTLHLLLDEASVPQRGSALNARKLLLPLACSEHDQGSSYPRSVRCLKLCFRLLEDPGTKGGQVPLTEITAALRLSLFCSPFVHEVHVWTFLYRAGSDESRTYWGGPPDWHRPEQFDLLVDYLVHVSQGTDYTAIGDAFAVLAGLRGSPSTLKRKHTYIQTTIQFMEWDIPLRTRHAAMNAVYALRTEVALMGRDDESLRDLFSQALTAVMRARDPLMQQRAGTSVDDNPFNELWIVNRRRDLCYLGLICALAKEPTWHTHLDHHGHFKSCLAIADSLSSRHGTDGLNGGLAAHLTHIFAVVDELGGDREFLKAVRMYPIWPLILLAWSEMFAFPFFYHPTSENWEEVSSWDIVDSLPPVAAYAEKYWELWDSREETNRLIQLVKQVSHKLNEEEWRSPHSTALELEQEIHSFEHSEIQSLSQEIRSLLYNLSGNMSP